MSDMTLAWMCSCVGCFILGIVAERVKNYITSRYTIARLEDG